MAKVAVSWSHSCLRIPEYTAELPRRRHVAAYDWTA